MILNLYLIVYFKTVRKKNPQTLVSQKAAAMRLQNSMGAERLSLQAALLCQRDLPVGRWLRDPACTSCKLG